MKKTGQNHGFWLSDKEKSELKKETDIRDISMSQGVAIGISLLVEQGKKDREAKGLGHVFKEKTYPEP